MLDHPPLIADGLLPAAHNPVVQFVDLSLKLMLRVSFKFSAFYMIYTGCQQTFVLTGKTMVFDAIS